jgi:hypothetical protein
MILLSVFLDPTFSQTTAKYFDAEKAVTVKFVPTSQLIELIAEMQRAILRLWGSGNNGTLLGYDLKTNKNNDKSIKFHLLAVIGQFTCKVVTEPMLVDMLPDTNGVATDKYEIWERVLELHEIITAEVENATNR